MRLLRNSALELMPFGNSVRRLSRRDIVRIAQRFNAGLKAGREASPGGKTEKRGFGVGFCRPSGTLGLRPRQPSVETLGYYRMSLRDKLLPEFPKGITFSPPLRPGGDEGQRPGARPAWGNAPRHRPQTPPAPNGASHPSRDAATAALEPEFRSGTGDRNDARASGPL